MSAYNDASTQVTMAGVVGDCILLVGSATGFTVSIINYFLSHNGINHTWGAPLVVVSSGIVLAAALVLAFLRPGRLSLRLLLFAGVILLGLLGTALAAFFLESIWLIAAMALVLVGWLLRVITGRADPQRFQTTRTHGVP